MLKFNFLLIFFIFALFNNSFANNFEEGENFILLDETSQIDKKSKTIEEFFFYGCIHCFNIQSSLKEFKKKLSKEVSFLSVPVIFSNETTITFAKLYHTLVSMKKLDENNLLIYETIHNEKKNIQNYPALLNFVESLGVDRKKFDKFFNSFFIDSKVKNSQKLTRQYNIEGTPTFIVNGKYKTSLGMVRGDKDKFFNLLNYLLDK